MRIAAGIRSGNAFLPARRLWFLASAEKHPYPLLRWGYIRAGGRSRQLRLVLLSSAAGIGILLVGMEEKAGLAIPGIKNDILIISP